MIRGELPDVAILVLSAHVDVEHAMELLSGGQRIGYLLKSRVIDVTDFLGRCTASRVARRWWTLPWCRNCSRRSGGRTRWRC